MSHAGRPAAAAVVAAPIQKLCNTYNKSFKPAWQSSIQSVLVTAANDKGWNLPALKRGSVGTTVPGIMIKGMMWTGG